MRSLREKLGALSTAQAQKEKASQTRQTSSECYRCETRYPLSMLGGIEKTDAKQVRRVDPRFDAAFWDPYKVLFFDTETTGLSGGVGTVAFLIGLGWLEGDEMVVRQYLMRDYDEELPMLEAIAKELTRFDAYVTFNGKSFDLPLLQSRLTMNRLRGAYRELLHVDLLHAARRIYKLRLGRCNLGTLEECVLGMPRENDLPGAQVPERYFEYLKTREFALLRDVLVHNALDIRSLAVLLAKLCEAFSAPEQLGFHEDIFGVGRTLERGGYVAEARKCYYLVSGASMGAAARNQLAQGYKKARDWKQAEETYQQMIGRGEGGLMPYIELAKYCEHQLRDYKRAIQYTREAMEKQHQRALLGKKVLDDGGALQRRMRRLQGKMQRQETARGKDEEKGGNKHGIHEQD